MLNIKKLSLAGLLIALGVISSVSAFYIPIGASKCFPVQHFINVLAGILLGPVYAVGMAFVTSIIRLMLGAGTLLAFPGSMIGALLCGLLYKYTKSKGMAFIGEVFGTGILGAIIAYPIAALFLSKPAALYFYVVPFALSSFVGAAFSAIFIVALEKTGILNKFNGGLNSYGI